MTFGEILALVGIIAVFASFGITLAWVSHGDAVDRRPTPRHSAGEAASPAGRSYQGADG